MIFVWIAKLLRALSRLILLPRVAETAKVDPNVPCPVCGARSGELRCVERDLEVGAKNGVGRRATLCQHRCKRCGARFYEAPVARVNPRLVQPAIPRDDVERLEDAREALRPLGPNVVTS